MTSLTRYLSRYLLRAIQLSPRPFKRFGMVLLDAGLLMFSVWAAFAVRMGVEFIPNSRQITLMVGAPLLALPLFVRRGLYRSVLRYLGEQALWSVFQAVGLGALLWAGLAFMTQMTGLEGVPRSVPLLYALFALVLIGGYRFMLRALIWTPLRERFAGRQVLIYGAGDAGWQLARALRRGRTYFPAGFLDDLAALQGKDVDGLRVYAPQHLPDLMSRFDIRDVIVALPGASAQRRREVVQFLESHAVRVRILPGMSDLANGTQLLNLVREADLGDLLGRAPVAPDPELLARCVRSKSVLVTGAGGSIGSELCMQLALLQPRRLILLESSEPALYQIERRLRECTALPVVAVLGSVAQSGLVERLLRAHGVETVYHAAAHKHVPLLEQNVLEAVRNNVFGTLALVRAVRRNPEVETLVLISSDKAVHPCNVMGATKRWAELIVRSPLPALEEETPPGGGGGVGGGASSAGAGRLRVLHGSPQRLCAVRFGNVLGSSGSVIPLFREQIARGGPVTVTHPAVTRYFMSIHEAVELVIQAGSLAEAGAVFLLDMGEPVRIVEMARNLIHMAGGTVRDSERSSGTVAPELACASRGSIPPALGGNGADGIEIVYTGLRPGEKMDEELLVGSSPPLPTAHPKILRAVEKALDGTLLARALNLLEQNLQNQDEEGARKLLFDLCTLSSGVPQSQVVQQEASG